MKIHVTWEEFNSDIIYLAERLKSSKILAENIYGIPRGGMIPAVILSHQLGLPIITQQRFISKNTIVVDDIVDTGETLLRILKRKKPLAVACIWYHPKAKVKPEFFARLKETEDWLVFPFETLSSSKYDRTV